MDFWTELLPVFVAGAGFGYSVFTMTMLPRISRMEQSLCILRKLLVTEQGG